MRWRRRTAGSDTISASQEADDQSLAGQGLESGRRDQHGDDGGQEDSEHQPSPDHPDEIDTVFDSSSPTVAVMMAGGGPSSSGPAGVRSVKTPPATPVTRAATTLTTANGQPRKAADTRMESHTRLGRRDQEAHGGAPSRAIPTKPEAGGDDRARAQGEGNAEQYGFEDPGSSSELTLDEAVGEQDVQCTRDGRAQQQPWGELEENRPYGEKKAHERFPMPA